MQAGRASGQSDSQENLRERVRFGESMKGKGGREGKAHMVGAKGSEGPWWMLGQDRRVETNPEKPRMQEEFETHAEDNGGPACMSRG